MATKGTQYSTVSSKGSGQLTGESLNAVTKHSDLPTGFTTCKSCIWEFILKT